MLQREREKSVLLRFEKRPATRSRTTTNGGKRLPKSSVLRSDEAFVEKFWAKAQKPPFEEEEATGCWLWVKRKKGNGYAQHYFRRGGVKYHLQAHRVAWMLAHGRWPSKRFDIDHTCHCRDCVNPAHLRQRLPELNRNNDAERPKKALPWNWKNQFGKG